jgi:hypothetical protein
MRGAVALEKEWLAKDSLEDVAIYVVWSPQLGAEEKYVAGAAALVPDARARHYWDGGKLVGSAYQPIVGSKAAAWDTWMLFDRNTMWTGDAPPKPAWWEHQMSSGPPGLMLDATRFASHAQALHDVNASHR